MVYNPYSPITKVIASKVVPIIKKPTRLSNKKNKNYNKLANRNNQFNISGL